MFFSKTLSQGRAKPAEVHDMLANRESFLLLDVRTQAEYMGAHIAGSTLLPLDRLEQDAGRVIPQKNTPVVVYCASGARSAQASRVLRSMGYEDVRDMGGIMSWPFGVVSGR